MAHYAFITAGIVTEVIVGRDENDLAEGISSWEDYYATKRVGQVCKRTSYNGNFRGTYAGIGYIYDAVTDTFTPPPTPEPDEA